MNLRRKQIALGIIIPLLILAVIYFLGFTRLGYVTTIQYRGFSRIQENIYIDDDYQGDGATLISIINDANNRLTAFVRDIQSQPTIIISDNEKKLKRMGWTGNSALTTTYVFGGAHSYVVITPNGLNIDVVAHELTHAELHKRLYNGKILQSTLVPFWFDEGFALQVDYRERYDDNAWIEVTDHGENMTDFANLETASQFFNQDADIRKYNYIISKYEVKQWIEQHSVEELLVLISDVNLGKEFNDLYYSK